jgi:regulator of protease activity HflC (stomatin/prohibitin superfamily)
MTAYIILIVGFVLLVILAMGLRIVQQYERGVVFRLGRVQSGVRDPGLRVIIPVIDRMVKVNMQIVTMGVPAQEGITRDNVTLRVDAVVYFRVTDAIKAIVNVQNYLYAVSQVAQTSLRSVIGQSDLDDVLSERERINGQLRAIIDEPTEGPWGIKIERVEVKDVQLPESMKRSMSRQAEAERERRARIIAADGEFQASKKLAEAARAMSADPSALQLRLLQTVVEVAAEKNSTLVMPFPVELLRFLDRVTTSLPPEPHPAAAHSVGAGQSAVGGADHPTAPAPSSASPASTPTNAAAYQRPAASTADEHADGLDDVEIPPPPAAPPVNPPPVPPIAPPPVPPPGPAPDSSRSGSQF